MSILLHPSVPQFVFIKYFHLTCSTGNVNDTAAAVLVRGATGSMVRRLEGGQGMLFLPLLGLVSIEKRADSDEECENGLIRRMSID